jgi:cold shock CspA family protein
MDGTFKGWLEGKRFGFIAPDDRSQDVFLHHSAVSAPMQLRMGTRVRFEAETPDNKGRVALGLTIIGPLPQRGSAL